MTDIEKASIFDIVRKTICFNTREQQWMVQHQIATTAREKKLKNDKAIEKYYKGKPFIFKLNENIFWGFTLPYDPAHCEIYSYELRRVKTNKGYLYVNKCFCPFEKQHKVIVFTQHFFERMMQRTNSGKTIDDVIISFITQMLTWHYKSNVPAFKGDYTNGCCTIAYGLGGGYGYWLARNITFIKTFVSDLMMYQEQMEEMQALEKKYQEQRPIFTLSNK